MANLKKIEKTEVALQRDKKNIVEQSMEYNGWACCYRGPLVLGQDLADKFPVQGSDDVSIRRLAIFTTDKNDRTHRMHLTFWERCDDANPNKDLDFSNEINLHFSDGEAAYTHYDQVVTINGREVRCWTPHKYITVK